MGPRTLPLVARKQRQEIIDHIESAIKKAIDLTPGCPVAMDLYTLKAFAIALAEADEYIGELERATPHEPAPKQSLLDNTNEYYTNYYKSFPYSDSEVITGSFHGSRLTGFPVDEWLQGFDNNWWVEIYACPYTEDKPPKCKDTLPKSEAKSWSRKGSEYSEEYPPLWGFSETPWVLGPCEIMTTLGNTLS